MTRSKSKPSVKRAVADRYALYERVVEFSFPSGRGGLLSLRTLEDGTDLFEVYRVDSGVVFAWPAESTSTVGVDPEALPHGPIYDPELAGLDAAGYAQRLRYGPPLAPYTLGD